ncbi:hypothetical protein [Teredinibacter franksiae]|uniref:hypothetical protein n=1 Tax=Teredinibacter franksiae TaxID=2761453 RepID=UPI001628F4CF|nr:hypothetical protein [Teredinibacter franksiae]
MNSDNKHLYHGSDWAEHEDVLIGNKEGLEALRFAIDEAIEKGESKTEIGEFLAIRCLDSKYFEKQGNVNTFGSKIAFVLIGVAFILTAFLVWLAVS